MRGIKEFLKPNTLEETLKLVDSTKENHLILAGGTHLGLQKNTTKDVIIDITNLGLNLITEEQEYIKIGATTTITQIFENKTLKSFANGILTKASSKIGSNLTKNMVTIGGNLYSSFPWSNIPPALLVLNAEIELKSLNSTRKVTIEDFIFKKPNNIIKNNEIITAIYIPKASQDFKTSYKVFSLTENDDDLVIVATSIKSNGNICQKAKIAIGAAVSPCCLIDSASILDNKELTSSLIAKVAEDSINNLTLINDFRTTTEHQKNVIKTLVKRTLEDCK